MTWEGGVRVPFLARWPGRVPAGKTCDSLASPMDVLPTFARLCGAPLRNPVDGIDIWPLLSGARAEIESDLLLYFDDVHLQCARQGRWKLHVARYNTVTYSPNPPGGRLNLPLARPELYDVTTDLDESYDAAPEHPEIVARIQARMETLMAGFPEDIRKAWAAARARKNAETRTGTVSRPPAM
jgi:arylsulfatase A